MIPDPRPFYILPGADPVATVERGAGKLRLSPTGQAAPGAYSILDTFDGAVRGTGAMLIEAGGALQLLPRDGGPCRQSAARDGGFVADMAPGPVRDALDGLSPLRSLHAIAGGTAEAQDLALLDKEGKTHVRVQVLTLHPEEGEGVALVQVQTLRGYDKARNRLCAALAEAENGQTDHGSLYAVLCPLVRPHKAKPNVPLNRGDGARYVACDLISAHIPVARATEPGIIADLDTEYLHDYRVALRKVRSVLSLFKGVFCETRIATLKTAFAGVMGRTGRLRDLDVYLLDKAHYFEMVPETLHPGLAEMFRLFEAERQGEQARFAKYLRSAGYARTITALDDLFAQPEQLEPGPDADLPAYDFARRLIWKRYRKVCKIASAIHADTDDAEVHELRIHCKKLRYLMEFFTPFFPKKEIKTLIRALKGLQDNLGLFNDYSVQQDSLKSFLDTHSRMRRAQYGEVAQSIGALIAVLHDRQTAERAKVMDNFAHFNSPETSATFRRLFKSQGGLA